MSPEPPTATARLCAQCGMCCNGVLFHKVELRSGDDAPALRELGFRVRRKQRTEYFEQPCVAFRGTHCAIYAARPERCRKFQCRQLERVAAGKISEAEALATIQKVRAQLLAVEQLLAAQPIRTDPQRPIGKRFAHATSEPVDGASDPAGASQRAQLIEAMNRLDTSLDRDFRITS